jgi:cobalt-zinc-cadmium efflux system protein
VHAHDVPTGTRLKVAAIITSVFVVAEFLIGWWANSLALISDAGHNLTDVAALVLSAWAFAMASRPPDVSHTFGHYRFGVLIALVNVLTLVLLAGYIFYEGYQRLIHPDPVLSGPMIVVAIIAFALNLVIALTLREASQHDVNVRSAFVHMAGDAASAIGVLIAGIGVMVTGSPLWDPIVSLLIGVFLLVSGWGVIQETVTILLESTPKGINLDKVAADIERLPGIQRVHDLHVWSLGSDVRALSAHVVLTDPDSTSQRRVTEIVCRVKQMLASRYAIAHATLETHCCEDADTDTYLSCDLQHVSGDGHDVQHAHYR